jgi:hypothetical protein
MKKIFKIMFLIPICILASCAMQETPRDADSVSTSNTKTLTKPKITNSDEKGISIRYAQISIGFDANCNPNRIMRDELNECSKLPENVKSLAIQHCESFGKKALFLGNKTNLIQMTVSKFECE